MGPAFLNSNKSIGVSSSFSLYFVNSARKEARICSPADYVMSSSLPLSDANQDFSPSYVHGAERRCSQATSSVGGGSVIFSADGLQDDWSQAALYI